MAHCCSVVGWIEFDPLDSNAMDFSVFEMNSKRDFEIADPNSSEFSVVRRKDASTSQIFFSFYVKQMFVRRVVIAIERLVKRISAQVVDDEQIRATLFLEVKDDDSRRSIVLIEEDGEIRVLGNWVEGALTCKNLLDVMDLLRYFANKS
jgi:hypothetical protein